MAARPFFLILSLLHVSLQDSNWWKSSVVYQIYPRSFQDCDTNVGDGKLCKDGIGDLVGIIQRLDHLVDIGADTFWLSPVYKSPMADFGYDISDYTDVDPTFGTMADFTQLAEEAAKRNLSIVMDFVPNHSSNQHPWFIKSENRTSGFEDFYIWRDGTEENGTKVPPNNWLSVFRGSAWSYSEVRKQWYYHAFTPEQPDLNYRNEEIVSAWKEILKFWLEKGVKGFRMDAVPFLFEDPEFRDEPVSGKTEDTEDYGYLNHTYTFNLPEVKDVLRTLTEFVHDESNGEAFVMVEALNPDLTTQDMMAYYNCSDFPFNFNFIVHLNSKTLTAATLEAQVRDWVDNLPEGKTANWVLGNHDNWRLGSRFHESRMDGFNMVALLLPGVAVTYYGEEIGMTNTPIPFNQTVDPQGKNCGPDHYTDEFCSRDFERTPMQWDETDNAGFTKGTPWLPVNDNYKSGVTVKNQSTSGSHLDIYKQLTKLRKTDVFKMGSLKTKSDQHIFAFSRQTQDKAYIVAFYVSDGKAGTRIDLTDLLNFADNEAKVILRSVGAENSETVVGKVVDISTLLLQPQEAVVIEVTRVQRDSASRPAATWLILAAILATALTAST